MPQPSEPPVPPEPEPRGLDRLKAEGRQQHPVVVRNVDDALRLGEIFVRSGFFEDSKAVSQAVVKVLYGVELGLSPIVAMNSIDVVEGKVAPGAQLTASKIETHPLYDYRVLERTRDRCEIEFLRRRDRRPDGEWEVRGTVVWDVETAEAAGLVRDNLHPKSPWRAYRQAMLYSRAITEGARAYCPDLFHGIAAYTAEELRGGDDQPEPFNLEPPPPPPPSAPPTVGEPEPADGEALEGEVQEPGGDGQPPADPPADEPQGPQGGPEGPSPGPSTPEGGEPAQASSDDAAADAAWGVAAGTEQALPAGAPVELEPAAEPERAAPARKAPPNVTPATPGTPRGRLATMRLRGLETMGASDDALVSILEAELGDPPDVYLLGDDDLYNRVRGLVAIAAERQPART